MKGSPSDLHAKRPKGVDSTIRKGNANRRALDRKWRHHLRLGLFEQFLTTHTAAENASRRPPSSHNPIPPPRFAENLIDAGVEEALVDMTQEVSDVAGIVWKDDRAPCVVTQVNRTR